MWAMVQALVMRLELHGQPVRTRDNRQFLPQSTNLLRGTSTGENGKREYADSRTHHSIKTGC
jgi:hypothetical protein